LTLSSATTAAWSAKMPTDSYEGSSGRLLVMAMSKRNPLFLYVQS
jgi:hypothetical protein